MPQPPAKIYCQSDWYKDVQDLVLIVPCAIICAVRIYVLIYSWCVSHICQILGTRSRVQDYTVYQS